MKTSVFISLPSARGVHPLTTWFIMDALRELQKHDVYLGGHSVYRMPLDTARNEMATSFLSTSAELNLLLDDDCWMPDVSWLPKMVDAVTSGEIDILSAPCRLRDHSHGGAQEAVLFNIRPTGDLQEKGGLRVFECEQTGLGIVLTTRKVIRSLFDAEEKKYAARMTPGSLAAPIFRSEVLPATDLVANAPEDLNVYSQDDVVFSLKSRKLGYKIYACVDVPTCHDGMAGCFADEMEKIDRARARAARADNPLLGPDGKPAVR